MTAPAAARPRKRRPHDATIFFSSKAPIRDALEALAAERGAESVEVVVSGGEVGLEARFASQGGALAFASAARERFPGTPRRPGVEAAFISRTDE